MTDEATRLAELEADNRRLRRLLDHAGAPSELRHRLNSTLALLNFIIRKSAETDRDLEAYVGHLQDRVAAIARAQAAADANGSVDMHTMLADELFYYKAREEERLSLSGPVVHLQPRAGQVLALAVHELAVNAVEHGVLGLDAGRIAITWGAEISGPSTLLFFEWREHGLGGAPQSSHRGFGTEVLTRMVTYELDAETTLALEADGLVCSIRFQLTPRIGSIEDSRDIPDSR